MYNSTAYYSYVGKVFAKMRCFCNLSWDMIISCFVCNNIAVLVASVIGNMWVGVIMACMPKFFALMAQNKLDKSFNIDHYSLYRVSIVENSYVK